MQPKKVRVLPAVKIEMAEVNAASVVDVAAVVATTETKVVAVTAQRNPVPHKTTRWLVRLTQQRPQKAVAMDAAATAVTALSVKRASRVKPVPSANHPRRHRWHALRTATPRIPRLSTPCQANTQTANQRQPTWKAATTRAAVADAEVEVVEVVATGLIVVTAMAMAMAKALAIRRALKNRPCMKRRCLQRWPQAIPHKLPSCNHQRPMAPNRPVATANSPSVASVTADAAVVAEDAIATGATPKWTTHLVKFSTPKLARWTKPERRLRQPTRQQTAQAKSARSSWSRRQLLRCCLSPPPLWQQ